MANISKYKADEIVEFLLKGKYEKKEQLLKDAIKVVTEIYDKRIPEDLMACFEKYPQHFSTTNTITIQELGISNRWIRIERRPSMSKDGVYIINLTLKEANKISRELIIVEEFQKSLRKLETDLTQTILQLKTLKRIKESFPESATIIDKMLPNGFQIAIPLEDIKKRLSKL